MASNETVKPKSILKHSSSLDHRDSVSHKEMTWDEMNILATHHPADKDYGHMKIDEPPTPYSKYSDVEEEEGEETRRGSVGEKLDIDPNALASRLKDTSDPKILRHARLAGEEEDDEEEDEEDDEDEEQKEQRHNFELKRKLHYNEYQAVQLAKKLMSEEEDEEEEEENDTNNASDKMDLSSPLPASDKPT